MFYPSADTAVRCPVSLCCYVCLGFLSVCEVIMNMLVFLTRITLLLSPHRKSGKRSLMMVHHMSVTVPNSTLIAQMYQGAAIHSRKTFSHYTNNYQNMILYGLRIRRHRKKAGELVKMRKYHSVFYF